MQIDKKNNHKSLDNYTQDYQRQQRELFFYFLIIHLTIQKSDKTTLVEFLDFQAPNFCNYELVSH